MDTRVDEIAADTFRISTFHPDFGIQFNQFLVRDDEPFLMHTGHAAACSTRRSRRSRRLIDPARLRWIGFRHFEPDECGALNEWLAVAPRAKAASGFVGTMVMLDDFADRPARMLADGEVLATGSHRLRFLSTPHLPHGWDAGLFFDETDRHAVLLGPVLPARRLRAAHRGRSAVPAVRQAIVEGMQGPLAHDIPYTHHTDAALRRLAALAPRTLAIMHGSSFRGDGGRVLAGFADVLRETIGPR